LGSGVVGTRGGGYALTGICPRAEPRNQVRILDTPFDTVARPEYALTAKEASGRGTRDIANRVSES
jgi:hypothetical protein